MDDGLRIAYSEVFEILKYMDKELVSKIPIELLNNFKNNRIRNYKVKIDKNDIFNRKNISRQTLSILGYLNLNYWVDENKKSELKSLYRKNEYEYSENLKNKYPIDVFKNNQTTINKNDNSIEKKALIEYKQNNLFAKFIEMIRNIFFKKRNRN